MVGGTTALLRFRLALAGALLAVLGFYYATSELLPRLPELGDVVLIGFALTALAFAPVYLALPLRHHRLLLTALVISASIALVLYLSGATLVASIPKLVAAALVGFLFLSFFERLSWVVLVAVLIPWVDTLSVWRGPTNKIVTTAPQVFDAFSVAFPTPGERTVTLRWEQPRKSGIAGYRAQLRLGDGRFVALKDDLVCTPADSCGNEISFADVAAPADTEATYRIVTVTENKRRASATIVVPAAGRGSPKTSGRSTPLTPVDLRAETAPSSGGLGLSDVIFFALFLAAAARYRLRPLLTWIALVVSLGITTVLAVYVDFFGTHGLPALPLISLAFLIANADLIWRRLRAHDDTDGDRSPRVVPLPRR